MRLKLPSPSVAAVLAKPVSWFFAVTLAPGMTAPFGSSTRPSMLPVVACDCASAAAAERATHAHSANARVRKGVSFLSMESSFVGGTGRADGGGFLAALATHGA